MSQSAVPSNSSATPPPSELRRLPVADRLRLSIFVILLGCGYLAGFVYIQLTTIPDKAEFSVTKMPRWVAKKYHGDDVPLLIRMVSEGGKMRKYMQDPTGDIPKIAAWFEQGMPESEFKSIQPIFAKVGPEAKSCLACHVRELDNGSPGEEADAPLESYDDVKARMRLGGMSLENLVRLTHFHLIGMGLMALGFTWVWMKTGVTGFWRGAFMVLPFAAICFDIGGWWLTWLNGSFCYVVLFGGTLYGISSLVLTLVPLLDMWTNLEFARRPKLATPPSSPPATP